MTFQMAHFDTTVILDISLWKKPRPDIQANLLSTTAHNWMWSTQMHHNVFGAIAEINTSEKEGWPGEDKSDVGW